MQRFSSSILFQSQSHHNFLYTLYKSGCYLLALIGRGPVLGIYEIFLDRQKYFLLFWGSEALDQDACRSVPGEDCSCFCDDVLLPYTHLGMQKVKMEYILPSYSKKVERLTYPL